MMILKAQPKNKTVGFTKTGLLDKKDKRVQEALALRGDGRTIVNSVARNLVQGPLTAEQAKKSENANVAFRTVYGRQDTIDKVEKQLNKKKKKGDTKNNPRTSKANEKNKKEKK